MTIPTDDVPPAAPASTLRLCTFRDGLVCAAAGCVLCLFRWHAFDVPLETDECNYAYIAARFLQGDRLYLDVWDHQPFGIFALLAGVVALFGDAPAVFRLLALGFSLISLVLIFGLAKKWAGLPAGVFAVALFALCSSDPGTAGDGCNREIYMNTFVLAAWWLVSRPRPPAPTGVEPPARSPRDEPALEGIGEVGPGPAGAREPGRLRIFAAGACLALGSSLKTLLAVHWVFLLGWLLMAHRRRGPASRSAWSIFVWFSVAPALFWLMAFAYFGASGRLAAFWEAAFAFNVGYAEGTGPALLRFVHFFAPQRFPFVFDSALPLWLAGAAATGWTLIAGVRARDSALLSAAALVLAAYVAVCLPGRFWPHYYYLLVPPMVLAAAVALGRFVSSAERIGLVIGWPRVGWLPGIVLVLFVAHGQYVGYLRQSPFGVTVTRYNSRDFWGRAIGEKVRQVTEPDDAIFVYGNEAEIYYYSRRRCASRYTMITGLEEGRAGAERRRREMIDDLRREKPRVVLVLFDQPGFPAWGDFLARNYGTAVGWDCHDRFTAECDHPRLEQVIMLVYADPQRPIDKIDWSWDRAKVGGWELGDGRRP